MTRHRHRDDVHGKRTGSGVDGGIGELDSVGAEGDLGDPCVDDALGRVARRAADAVGVTPAGRARLNLVVNAVKRKVGVPHESLTDAPAATLGAPAPFLAC